MTAHSNRKDLPGLDVLRGISILCVLIYHVSHTRARVDLEPISAILFSVGWAGVDLFFGISGFLVARILFVYKEQIRAFAIKRLFRILPLYFLAVTLYLVSALVLKRDDLSHIWLTYLLLTGWMVPLIGFNDIPYLITWSISVEEFAYTLLASLRRITLSSPHIVLIGGIIFCLAFRTIAILSDAMKVNEVYYFPLARLDSIFFGSIVALNGQRFPITKRALAMLFIATIITLSLLTYFGQYNFFVATLGYTVLGAVAAGWVLVLATLDFTHIGKIAHFISYIGRRSYFIYLFHVFVLAAAVLAASQLGVPDIKVWPLSIIVLVITLVLAECSWRLFEYPLIQLGRKISRKFA